MDWGVVVGEGGRSGRVVSERSGGKKYVAGVSASPGHCSLSITSIVRYREAGEKRELGIHAEFPVFVVAAGLFFPPPFQSRAAVSNRTCLDWR